MIRYLKYLGFSLFVVIVLWLAWLVRREQFVLLISLYGIAFGLSLWLANQNLSKRVVFWVGVLLRVLVLFSLPQLSNDIYRFIWDGRLLVAGEDPFALRPGEWMAMMHPPSGINQELHQLIYADNYTVYPPIHQIVFWLSAKLSTSIEGSIWVLKSVLVLGEIVLLWFLRKASRLHNLFVFYTLSPLVILEISGNGHFEALMVLFLILGLDGLRKKDWRLAGIGLGLAIATKLLPLMLLPVIWMYIGRESNGRREMLFWLVGVNVVLWLPLFFMGSMHHMMESIWLYFESFEFNASVFYLLKWLAPNGWRIGLITNGLTVGALLYFAFRQKVFDYQQLVQSMALIWGIYLLNSAIVHPWYVLPVFVLSVLANRWVGVVWSGLIYLSYSHYWGGGMQENYGVIGLEYVLLLVVFLFLRKQEIGGLSNE